MTFHKFYLNKKSTHTTNDEMVYIQTIGLHQIKKMNRLDLLKSYVKSLELRQNWGDMDKFKVVTFANDYLQKELSYVI